MALPIQSAPKYSVTIPSTEETVNFRPFIVKEQKSLLLAQQSEKQGVMIDTLKDVISACTFNKIDVSNLALFDLEYLFTQIRAKSVGETVELVIKCNTCTDEKARAKVSYDLTNIEVKKDENHNKKIPLFDDVGVMMKYPNFDMIRGFENIQDGDVEELFGMVSKCIDYIYNTEEVFHTKDLSKEEVDEFLNNLTQDQFSKIQNFFETLPKIYTDLDYICPVCEVKQQTRVEGINSFF